MQLENIYKCLSENDRIRIVSLLVEGPLCGCFLQEILGICQVKVSKQLAYLKKLGVVDSKREANWVVYMLKEPPHPVLVENIRMLRAPESGHAELAQDLEKRREMLNRVESGEKVAPQPVRKKCCLFGGCD